MQLVPKDVPAIQQIIEDLNINNLILNADSYKCSHWLQYPEGTTDVFSYISSRGGEYPVTLWAGFQVVLMETLSKVVTAEDVQQAKFILSLHGVPFNEAGWMHIVNVHGGKLPVVIKAAPEGAVIPTHTVLVTIEATDPECAWLVSYLETLLLRAAWYCTTVATVSWHIKQIIAAALDETGDPTGLAFKLHDFGARGVSSFESAGIGGLGHIVNFMGTDTITAVLYAMKYYAAPVCAFSIPAAEHSTITVYGKDKEVEAYRNMLRRYAKPGALVAVVSDSYDIFNACSAIWGGTLRQEVIDSGAVLIIRPDSGYPPSVVLRCIQLLDEKFGSVVNGKGYRVLNYVRVIQGDGITADMVRDILRVLKEAGYSADNVAFGMGGGLLQMVNRDTQKFAMKCSAALVDGVWVDVFKDPITDPGKRSLNGRVTSVTRVVEGRTQWHTIRIEELPQYEADGWVNGLIEVYRDGNVVKKWTFDELRAQSNVK